MNTGSRNAEKLRGLGISMYAGDGVGANDGPESRLIERGAGNSTHNLAKRLGALGIPHHWDMYGHDVSYGGFTCNGGHTVDCMNMAFSKDINRIMADIS